MNWMPNLRPYVMFVWPNLVLGAVFMAVALSFFIAPATLPPNSVNLGDNGTTMPNEKTNITSKMPPFQRAIYNFGDATCHQKSSRSFFINGNQMPLCARCTAIYVGMPVGILVFAFLCFEVKWWMLVLGLVPIGIDGVGQTILGLWESTNLMRVLTGFPAGFITGIMIGFLVSTLYIERRYRKEWERHPEEHQE